MSITGEIEISLDGKKHTLRATLRAARAVNSFGGGFVGAYQGLQRFDMSVMAGVIAAGLGKTKSEDVDEIEQKVFANGLDSLVEPLTRFVSMLKNGGREVAEDGEKGKTQTGVE